MLKVSKSITLKINVDIKKVPLPVLLSIARSLQLNEMEIALWSLHVDFSKWDLKHFQVYDCLLFSAILAKQQLCNDLNTLNACLYRIFALDPFSVKKYQDWCFEYPIKLSFSAAQINFQFSILRNVVFIIHIA